MRKPTLKLIKKYRAYTLALFRPALGVLFLSAVALAATASDYRTRIETARDEIEGLISYIDEGETGAETKRIAKETTDEIKRSIPESERIEMKTGSTETANQWLRIKLDEFEKEDDAKQQKQILTEISERLSAIAEKVGELENPASAGRSKDEDKQKLAEILRREEYQKPQEKEESLFQKWWREFTAWLESVFPKPKISPETSSGFQSLSFVLQILVYAAVIGLIGFVLYKFLPFFGNRFGRGEKKEKKDRVILGERIEAHESADNLFGEAERMARSGDLRGAIRKGYIALLCELSDRKVIGLASYKTNRDYLRDVRKRTGLFERMKGMTGSFEQHWYGFRSAGEPDWEEFRDNYRKAIREV